MGTTFPTAILPLSRQMAGVNLGGKGGGGDFTVPLLVQVSMGVGIEAVALPVGVHPEPGPGHQGVQLGPHLFGAGDHGGARQQDGMLGSLHQGEYLLGAEALHRRERESQT